MEVERINNKILWTQECINYIVEQYVNNKKSIANIAKEIKTSPGSVSKKLKENNIHIRTDREQALKYSANEHYFDVIDSEHKAYWLGFLYADGYIVSKRKHNSRKVGLALSIKDMERLEAFTEDINFTGPIKIYTINSSYKENTVYGRVLIASEHMAQQLIEKGCIEQKTKQLVFPDDSIVPKQYKYDFIRGYLDGDGSITVDIKNDKVINAYIGFTGTKEFLTGLKNYLGKSKLELDKRYRDRNDNIYALNIGGSMQTIEMCYRLYGHATTYMDRKYQKYRLIVNEYFKTGRAE